ncbi:MAG: alpha/beta fold hydrolase [Betaproteobacteria bacterium]|nr:alpha/beta fold hydrolase [Betaproteobacteria bacterium]
MRYYLWEGRGPTVVMLHPSGGYARIWERVVPYLLPDFRVIALDQRGHGDTDRPARGYAGEDFAQDLEQFLDTLRLDRVVLVGHSLGRRQDRCRLFREGEGEDRRCGWRALHPARGPEGGGRGAAEVPAARLISPGRGTLTPRRIRPEL